MPLLKVRSMPQLEHFSRAGHRFTPTPSIVDVDEETAKRIEADTRSLIAERVTEAEAAAFNEARIKATSDADSLAAENVALRADHAALSKRVGELEEALRKLLAEKGHDVGDDFGDEPSPRAGAGVKPSIAPGNKGGKRE